MEDIDPRTVLAVCASQKGRSDTARRSAIRGIMSAAIKQLEPIYPWVAMLDLAECPLPIFEGWMPRDIHSLEVSTALESVERCGALLLGIPAYWSAVSGSFKNFIEILCGPAYDFAPDEKTVFADKPVGLFIVGAERVSAARASVQAQDIVAHIGARLVGRPITVSSPRSPAFDPNTVIARVTALLAELAQWALHRPGQPAGFPREVAKDTSLESGGVL